MMRPLVVTAPTFAVLALCILTGCPNPEGRFPGDDGTRNGDPPACAPDHPTGTCDDGQTCRAGQCLDDALFCATDNPTGLCADDAQACLDGTCVDKDTLCSDTNTSGLCSTVDDLTCHDGVCATDSPCAADEPLGFCDTGDACLDGTCVDRALLCSEDNATGLCREDTSCVDGACLDDALLCSSSVPAGLCPTDESCVGGACHTEDELCSAQNQSGACQLGFACLAGECVDSSQVCGCEQTQTCVDGVCRDPDQLCSAANPTGVCGDGDSCIAGSCVDLGAACSPQNLTGVCPPGSLCEDGTCAGVDGSALCDDNNECTTDIFDTVRNRCVNEPRTGSCDDGNECTTDTCVDDVCTGAPIGGCIEPPIVDAVTSPTNVGSLALSGTKPAGASVEINAQTAVPQNPDATWTVNINLVPGDNVFVIDSVDGATRSAEREIHVVYDITPPTTRVTPDSGTFLTGITATLASDEPATVFMTTDGSDPTETSPSFASLKQLRIFADTHLRLRAKDLAGNLEATIVDVDLRVTGRGTVWGSGPTLAEGVSLAGATANGDDVFVVGGTDGTAPQAGAYVYSIADDALTTLPSLSGARDSLVVVALGTSVYAIGGQNAGTPLNRVEVLDDGAASWALKAAMPSTRHSLAAVVFNGKIYVFGGKANGGAVLTNVEVYDPTANSWSNAVAQMPHARAGHGAILVDNLVYVVGGEDDAGQPVAAVDIYDPGADSWSVGAPMPTPRSYLGVTSVENRGSIVSGPKAVLASGGLTTGGVASAVVEEYVIDDDAWYARAPLPAPRHSAAAVTVVVPGDVDSLEGEGWLLGGQEGNAIVGTTRTVRSSRDYASSLPDLPDARFLHAAAALDDRIYVFGGRNFSEETAGWAFDPETGTYEDLPELPSFQNGLGAVAVGDRVYAFGGADNFANAVATTRAFDPALHDWVELRPMTSGRSDLAVAVLGGDIYAIGGDNGGALQTVEIYTVADDTWRTGPLLPGPRKGAQAVAHDGHIYVVGGLDANGAAVTSILRLDGGNWTPLSGSIDASFGAAFALQGRIAVFGGRRGGVVTNAVSEYDVATQAVQQPRTVTITPAVDRFAAALDNGRLFFFGGNETEDVGPQGTALVRELDARCFDGVLNGREVAGGFAADDGGGCPAQGFIHHTGINGETFSNATPPSTTSSQGALNACNAHFGGNVCEIVDCGGCDDVAKPRATGESCVCPLDSPDWLFASGGCLTGTGSAGQVLGSNCSQTVIGSWD